ncbi:hypothetical protein V8J36_10120 [Frigidibacter sp. MR17.14]|uniref:hypothetical protein n=1 Tax=Frigidibacter sp. MR17.14 TaxID=3126509 RepID=UPI00301306C8
MKPMGIIGMVGVGALAACGNPNLRESPQGFSATHTAMSPGSPIAYKGESFHAGVTRGPAGLRFTGAGAQAVSGEMVSVTRAGGAMRYDEGKAAKDVARLACEGAGRRYDATAQGRFVAGSWQFAGACA